MFFTNYLYYIRIVRSLFRTKELIESFYFSSLPTVTDKRIGKKLFLLYNCLYIELNKRQIVTQIYFT